MDGIHIKTELSTIRVFKDGDSYSKKSLPIFSCNMHHISDEEAYIFNAIGELTLDTQRAIIAELQSLGIKHLRFERRGKVKTYKLEGSFWSPR